MGLCGRVYTFVARRSTCLNDALQEDAPGCDSHGHLRSTSRRRCVGGGESELETTVLEDREVEGGGFCD